MLCSLEKNYPVSECWVHQGNRVVDEVCNHCALCLQACGSSYDLGLLVWVRSRFSNVFVPKTEDRQLPD